MQQAILADAAKRDGESRGLRTYRHAYRARLAGALRVGYPRLATALGGEAFRRLADRYAGHVPSRHFSIRWHGGALASYLHGAQADLARMEWALGLAFDAKDAIALGAADVRGMSAEALFDLPLRLHPATQVLAMSHDVAPWWEALAGAAPSRPRVTRRRHALIVWRPGIEVSWRTATTEEGEALVALHDAGSLAGACDGLSPQRSTDIGAWFARWIAEGVLVRAED